MNAAPLALTAGESAGIGPDLCLMAAQAARSFPLVCLADRDLLVSRARQLNLRCELQDYRPGAPLAHGAGQLSVWHSPLAATPQAGKLDPRNAPQVLTLIDRALEGCLAGEFAAMVTAPVHKGVINDAGVPFSGHTEYIAARCGIRVPVMLLSAGSLKVALATTHLPLRAVPDAITTTGLTTVLQVLVSDLTRLWGIARPRVAVCGLNPHAGEGGHLGSEDKLIIEPAVNAARAAGLAVHGPLPADTVFLPRFLQEVDVVLAMYHDQGLPVLKYAGFGAAVNVTLGLPIVRTSVDHGTALDLAGSGRAEAGSLLAAITLATELAPRRH